jgi:flagellar biosynthesis protein FlhB
MLAACFENLLICTVYLVIPMALLGVLSEYSQIGVLFSSEKIKTNMNRINLAEGIKRLFNKSNFIEAFKSIVKAALVFLTCVLLLRQSLPDALNLFYAKPEVTLSLLWEYGSKIIIWILMMFIGIGMLDYFYQRHRYM